MFELPEISRQLLVVEHDAEKRNVLMTYFSRLYQCSEADSLQNAGSLIADREYPVILAAICPPHLNGLEILPRLRSLGRRSVPIFMSEGEPAGNTIKAYRAGAFDVIQMPMSLKKVESAIEKAFLQYEMQVFRDEYKDQVEREVAERIARMEGSRLRMETFYRMTVEALVHAIADRGLENRGHCERIVTFSLRLGYELGLDQDVMHDLEFGALLHDVGTVSIPDSILQKPMELNGDEWAQIKMHPLYGQKILRNIPFFDGARRIVAQHHERWDGKGYPHGLRGEAIEIGARVLAVIDAFDAMLSDKPYGNGISYANAKKEIQRCSGTQFDPVVVDAFLGIPEEDWDFLRMRSLGERCEKVSFRAVVSELVRSGERLETVH